MWRKKKRKADDRLEMAKKFGADEAIRADADVPERVKKVNGGFLADVVIICAGAANAIAQALGSVRRGGTVLFFSAADKDAAIPFSINDIFWRTEVTLTSSYAGTPQEHRQAIELIAQKKVRLGGMITHRLPLAQIERGFKLVTTAKDSLKVIIEPQK